MKFEYHIIVIGAGSGGLVVAAGAAGLGAKVALVEAEKMGGDCLNYGCVPSKTFLRSAHLAADIRKAGVYALEAELRPVDLGKVMGRVRSIIGEIEPHDSVERFEGLGVKVFKGKGVLVDRHTVRAGGIVLTARYIVLATGSDAYIPPISGLDGVPFITNRTVFRLEALPRHLIVLGGGPIGCELGQGFRQLGSQVSLVDKSDRLFTKDDPEVGPLMCKRFEDEGMNLHLGASIVSVRQEEQEIIVTFEKNGAKEEIRGDLLLVALGRKPVTEGLGLENCGVETDGRGYIRTNRKLQTNIPNIYACGDVAGPYQFTHMAGYQAGVVLRNTIFRLGAKTDYSAVPWTTYTRPEVAHVGYTEPWAQSLGLFQKKITVPLADLDRAKAENDREGFLKLILGKKNRIIGATLVGDKAGEMIPLAALALKQKLSAGAFMNLVFSYPTEAEIFSFAGRSLVKESFTAGKQKLVKFLFLR